MIFLFQVQEPHSVIATAVHSNDDQTDFQFISEGQSSLLRPPYLLGDLINGFKVSTLEVQQMFVSPSEVRWFWVYRASDANAFH